MTTDNPRGEHHDNGNHGFSEAAWEGLALDQLAEPLGWQPKSSETRGK
ncbi:hypothetical protein [Arthrobacter sp. A5]